MNFPVAEKRVADETLRGRRGLMVAEQTFLLRDFQSGGKEL